MGRYLAVFTIALIAVICATLALVALTGWDLPGSVGLIQMVFASFLAGMYFVKKQSRLPTLEERRWLIWRSFGVALLIPTIALVGFLGYLAIRFGLDDLKQGIGEITPKLPIFAWVLIAVFTLGSTYATLWFGYGRLTNQFGRKVLTKSVSGRGDR